MPDAHTACLLDGAFRVTGAMKNFATPPATFEIAVMDFAGGRAESDEAVFWESFEPGNFEVAVKMIDACSLPAGHPLRFYWAFFGGLTNQRTDMAIRDTVTGRDRHLDQSGESLPATVADTSAFPCTDPGGARGVHRDDETACLIGGRFEVTGEMRNGSNQIFPTRVMNTFALFPVPPRCRSRAPAPRPIRPHSSSPSIPATSRWA